MKHRALLMLIFCACSGAKLSVPADFKASSTAMPVKGINGWQVAQRLSFGDYQTSSIKRRWDFSSSVQYTRFGINPEAILPGVFDIQSEGKNNKQRGNFQYVIQDKKDQAEVYATEKFSEKQLVYKSNNPYIGQVSRDIRYEYAFTAAIVPLTSADRSPWSLVLINRYDASGNTARKLFDRPYVEEEGYATNGVRNYAIRPIHTRTPADIDGNEKTIIGSRLLAGYEIQSDGKPVAMIDILANNIHILNSLKSGDKLILSAISSAILLKRMQDVEKDKDSLG